MIKEKMIPKDELVALRVTPEMMTEAKKLIQNHGSTRSPLAAMLQADGCALNGDLNDFLFYAHVSMLCVVHVLLCSEDMSVETVDWDDVI